MDVQALNGYIRQGIGKEVFTDRIELYLPFFFGEGKTEPLCLTWDKKGVLSDGGRTLAELKKRVGDLTAYAESIQNILKALGLVTLEGGQSWWFAIIRPAFPKGKAIRITWVGSTGCCGRSP